MASGIAALIELMSVGKQNKVLNANPQITFWRFTHMRYTDFSMEQVKVDGNVSTLSAGAQTIHFDLPRSGDLVNNAFVVFHLPGLVNRLDSSTGENDAELKSWDQKLSVVDEMKENVLYGIEGTNKQPYPELVEDYKERSLRGGQNHVCGPEPCYIDSVGQYLCNEIRLQVGSQIVDTVYSYYLKMWDELSEKPGRYLSKGYGEMTMKGSREDRIKWSRRARSVFVPIQMFFMRTSGNALPLIALSFHGVKITVKTNSIEDCIVNKNSSFIVYQPDSSTFSDPKLYKTCIREEIDTITASAGGPIPVATTAGNSIDKLFDASYCRIELTVGYVYLGVAERNKFAEASFEILIDQVQKASETALSSSGTTTLNDIGFNHCVQELLWAVTGARGGSQEALDFTGEVDKTCNSAFLDTLDTCQLKLNNSKRFTHMDGNPVPATYFRQLEPYLHHTAIPNAGVYSYSFALNPESNQPSGTANFSRIDNSSFEVTHSTTLSAGAKLHLFARNWNVFRISLGLGGLVWAS